MIARVEQVVGGRLGARRPSQLPRLCLEGDGGGRVGLVLVVGRFGRGEPGEGGVGVAGGGAGGAGVGKRVWHDAARKRRLT